MESDATAEMKLQVCEVITPPFTVKSGKMEIIFVLWLRLIFQFFSHGFLLKGTWCPVKV